MIGNPYGFTVDWNHCALTSDSVSTLYYYAGQDTNFLLDRPFMEPWSGYWIYNARTNNAAVTVASFTGSSAKSAGVRGGAVTALKDQEWMVKLSASSGKTVDLDNYAGFRTDGAKNWDYHDRPEPPAMSNSILLAFDHRDWDAHAGYYAADIQPCHNEGGVWEFDVISWQKEQPVTLSWHLYNALPDGWKLFLFDLDEGTSVDMLKAGGGRMSYEGADDERSVRHFKLVAGTEAFIEANSDGIPLIPVKFNLSQNFPNPFNGVTEIRYSLPKRGEIELTIYNALGQKVSTLVDGIRKAGHHTVSWHGRDERGLPVASGIYIYRLKTPDKIASLKMVYIK
jgi:hypothetical protein